MITLLIKLIKIKANGFPNIGDGAARVVNWYIFSEADGTKLIKSFKDRCDNLIEQ